jgi:hypothetical protein
MTSRRVLSFHEIHADRTSNSAVSSICAPCDAESSILRWPIRLLAVCMLTCHRFALCTICTGHR